MQFAAQVFIRNDPGVTGHHLPSVIAYLYLSAPIGPDQTDNINQ